MSRPTHVVGLLFASDLTQVLLVRKAGLLNGIGGKIEPTSRTYGHLYDPSTGDCEWCGRNVSESLPCLSVREASAEAMAMAREFREKAGYAEEIAWRSFCRYGCPRPGTVTDFFCAADDRAFAAAKTLDESEPLVRDLHIYDLHCYPTRALHPGLFELRMVSNLLWLIPMAMNLLSGLSKDTFAIQETQ